MFELKRNPIRWLWKVTGFIADCLLWVGDRINELTEKLIDWEFSVYDHNDNQEGQG